MIDMNTVANRFDFNDVERQIFENSIIRHCDTLETIASTVFNIFKSIAGQSRRQEAIQFLKKRIYCERSPHRNLLATHLVNQCISSERQRRQGMIRDPSTNLESIRAVFSTYEAFTLVNMPVSTTAVLAEQPSIASAIIE